VLRSSTLRVLRNALLDLRSDTLRALGITLLKLRSSTLRTLRIVLLLVLALFLHLLQFAQKLLRGLRLLLLLLLFLICLLLIGSRRGAAFGLGGNGRSGLTRLDTIRSAIWRTLRRFGLRLLLFGLSGWFFRLFAVWSNIFFGVARIRVRFRRGRRRLNGPSALCNRLRLVGRWTAALTHGQDDPVNSVRTLHRPQDHVVKARAV